MNLFQRFIQRLVSQKSDRTFSLQDGYSRDGRYYDPLSLFTYFFNTGNVQFEDRNFYNYLLNAYGQNPYVYMVVDRLSDIGAGMKCMLVNSEEEEIEGEAAERFWRYFKAPNPMYSGKELIHKGIGNFLSLGNCIFYKDEPLGVGRVQDTPLNIAYLPQVEVQTASGQEGGVPIAYTIEGKTYLPQDVLHLKMPNIIKKSNWGLSPLYASQYVWEASKNTFIAQASIHKNKGIAGILSPKDSKMPLLPKEQQKMQEEWDSRTAGPEKTGRMHITTQPMDFVQVAMNATELRLLEHNIQYLRDICSVYGVDSSLFNDPQNKTYSNRTEAEKALYTDVIIPLMDDQIYRKLSEWLLPMFGLEDARIVVDKKQISVLNKPDAELSQKIVAEVNAGIISAEEAKGILYPELKPEEETAGNGLSEGMEVLGGEVVETPQERLRGSVGGVTGIVAIQRQVAEGVITQEAAIATLVELYGIEESIARQMTQVGTLNTEMNGTA